MKHVIIRTGLLAIGIIAAFTALTWLLSSVSIDQRASLGGGPSRQYVNRAYDFALQVPDGYRTRDEQNGVVIIPMPTRDVPNPDPVLQVRVRPLGEGAGVPEGSKVYTRAGKAYVVSLWRGTPWPLFDVTAKSLTFTR